MRTHGREWDYKLLAATSGVTLLGALITSDWAQLCVSIVAVFVSLRALALLRRLRELETTEP